MQSKPSCWWRKTTVTTYAAVIRHTTVVKIEALTCSLPVLLDWSEIVLSPASIGVPYVRRCTLSTHTLPLWRFHPFDYYVRTSQLPFDYSRNTVRRFRGYHSRDSADAFDDSDCADALKEICRYPLTILRILFEGSAEILWRLRGNPSKIPRKFFNDSADDLWKLTQQIRGYCKVSCDMYHIIFYIHYKILPFGGCSNMLYLTNFYLVFSTWFSLAFIIATLRLAWRHKTRCHVIRCVVCCKNRMSFKPWANVFTLGLKCIHLHF